MNNNIFIKVSFLLIFLSNANNFVCTMEEEEKEYKDIFHQQLKVNDSSTIPTQPSSNNLLFKDYFSIEKDLTQQVYLKYNDDYQQCYSDRVYLVGTVINAIFEKMEQLKGFCNCGYYSNYEKKVDVDFYENVFVNKAMEKEKGSKFDFNFNKANLSNSNNEFLTYDKEKEDINKLKEHEQECAINNLKIHFDQILKGLKEYNQDTRIHLKDRFYKLLYDHLPLDEKISYATGYSTD